MKKRIITSFKLFETTIGTRIATLGISGSALRKLMGDANPDEMSKAQLEDLLSSAKAKGDEDMVEEIEELIADIQISDLNPDDYDILTPPCETGGGGGGGGGGTPPEPPETPQNERPWPPKGSNPNDPPPPGPITEEPPGPKGPKRGDEPGEKPEKPPTPSDIIGKKARITHGPYAGQMGTIAGINSDGTIQINPE